MSSHSVDLEHADIETITHTYVFEGEDMGWYTTEKHVEMTIYYNRNRRVGWSCWAGITLPSHKGSIADVIRAVGVEAARLSI